MDNDLRSLTELDRLIHEPARSADRHHPVHR